MSFDLAGGRKKKARQPGVFEFWQDLGTPFRAERAATWGWQAAGGLCFVNLMAALSHWNHAPRRATLIGRDPDLLVAVSLFFAILAAWLAVVIYRRQPLWAAYAVLGWAILEETRLVTGYAYGQVGMGVLPELILAISILGFRGALAVRERARRADPTVFA